MTMAATIAPGSGVEQTVQAMPATRAPRRMTPARAYRMPAATRRPASVCTMTAIPR